MIELLIATVTFAIGAGITAWAFWTQRFARDEIVDETIAHVRKVLDEAGLDEADLKLMNSEIPKMAEVNWPLFEERIGLIFASGQEPNVADVLKGCETDEWQHIRIGSEPFYVNVHTHELMMESNSEIVPCPHPNKTTVGLNTDEFEWECVWCEYQEPIKKRVNPFGLWDQGEIFKLQHRLSRGEQVALPDGYTVEYMDTGMDAAPEPVIFRTGHTERIHT